MNALLVSGDNFPIPGISDLLDRLASVTIFSSLDLKAGYNQFTIHERDRYLLSFTWAGRQYMFVGAPFGVTPLSSAFQRVLASIFADLPFVVVYIDNIYVISWSVSEHVLHLQIVLERLNHWCLRLNLIKCCFFLLRVHVLGYTVSADGVSVDRTKLKGLQEIPIPTSGKQVSAFIGFCNYFRRFVPAFATLSAPLDAVRHMETIALNEAQLAAFSSLKEALLNAPILSFPDFSQPFGLATDASGTAVGVALLQPPEGAFSWSGPPNSSCRIIAFFSRAMSRSERSYSATKRELLAIFFGLKKCRFYLWGRPFTVFTDHRALEFLLSQRDASALFTRWFEELMEFSFTVVHIPGVANILPDCLSRLYPVPARELAIGIEQCLTLRLLPESRSLLVEPAIEERHGVLVEAHSFGHLGSLALENRVRESGFHWPSLSRDSQAFVDSCRTCQRFSVKRSGFHPLRTVSANSPMSHVAFDTAGPLPETPRGNVFLLVVVCLFTRFVFLRAIPDKSALTIAAALFNIFCEVGFPDILQSDNGTEVLNAVIDALLQVLNASRHLSTPYNPRGNGVAECWVKKAIRSIRKAIIGAQIDWDLAVPGQQFALNTAVVDLHGSAPVSLFFARSFPGFLTAVLPAHDSSTRSEAVVTRKSSMDEWREVIAAMEEIVFPAIRERRDAQNKKRESRFNRSHKMVSFPVGTYVMARDETRSGKLSPLFEGPYKVMRKTRGGSYVLLDTDGVLLGRNFAPYQLIPVPAPSSTDIPVEEVFTVESIINHRTGQNGYQYLVKWKGFDLSHNTWEPAENFIDISVITNYWKRRGSKA